MTPAGSRALNIEVANTAADGSRPLLALGFAAFCAYSFVFYSRILDVNPAVSALHIPAVCLMLASLIGVLGGRANQVLPHRIALYLVGFSFFLVASIPTAFWRGGSVRVLTGHWITAMMVFFAGAAVIVTPRQCRRAVYIIGLAAAAGAVLVSVRGEVVRGRLVMENSRFGNSNTVAIMLLLGMPMVWLLAAQAGASLIRKVFVYAVLLLMIAVLFRSGSREGIIALGFVCVTVFFRSSPSGKLRIVIALTLLVALSAAFLPAGLKARFATIFDGTSVEMDSDLSAADQQLLISAAGSSQTRWALLVTSLKVTAQHPWLGVGPGNFAPFLGAQAKAERRQSFWVGTHNTYTQVSAELGIPALCFYLLTLFTSIRTLKRIYRRAKRIPGPEAANIAAMALALHTSFLAYCVCCCFNHMAYEATMPLLAAFTVAIDRAIPGELSRLEQPAAVPTPQRVPNAPFPRRQVSQAV